MLKLEKIGGKCKNWQKLAKIGKNWQKLAKIGKNWQKLAKIGKNFVWRFKIQFKKFKIRKKRPTKKKIQKKISQTYRSPSIQILQIISIFVKIILEFSFHIEGDRDPVLAAVHEGVTHVEGEKWISEICFFFYGPVGEACL
jgi:hypothetical protein